MFEMSRRQTATLCHEKSQRPACLSALRVGGTRVLPGAFRDRARKAMFQRQLPGIVDRSRTFSMFSQQ